MNTLLRAELLGQITRAGFDEAYLDRLLLLHERLSADKTDINYFDLLNTALKFPQILHQKSETLAANIERSSKLLGLGKSDFVTAALRQPQLFCSKPETHKANVSQSAALLCLKEIDFATAALKQPQLFHQRPKTINDNTEKSALLLGFSKASFIAIALKKPQLFCQKPETLQTKKAYIEKIIEAIGHHENFAASVARRPALLCYGTNHLHMRYILIKLGLKQGGLSTVITFCSAKAEKLIADYYIQKIALTGKGYRALQVMRARKLIKSIPYEIPFKIQRPSHEIPPTP